MTRLTLISLDDTVVFPGMPVTLALDTGGDKHIFLMPRRGNEYAKVGVVAEGVSPAAQSRRVWTAALSVF